MSVIRKKPFIESVIGSLTDAQKGALLTILNSAGNNVSADFKHMPNKGITAVFFKLDEQNYKNGILIYTDDYCVLIAYHRFQDLLMYKLDTAKFTFEKINEYLDINELRRVIDDESDAAEIVATVNDAIESGDIAATSVIANPELEGEEDALESIEINGIAYSVGGGSGSVSLPAYSINSTLANLCDSESQNITALYNRCDYLTSDANYYSVFVRLVTTDGYYLEGVIGLSPALTEGGMPSFLRCYTSSGTWHQWKCQFEINTETGDAEFTSVNYEGVFPAE